jgi:hypothetical protein
LFYRKMKKKKNKKEKESVFDLTILKEIKEIEGE